MRPGQVLKGLPLPGSAGLLYGNGHKTGFRRGGQRFGLGAVRSVADARRKRRDPVKEFPVNAGAEADAPPRPSGF